MVPESLEDVLHLVQTARSEAPVSAANAVRRSRHRSSKSFGWPPIPTTVPAPSPPLQVGNPPLRARTRLFDACRVRHAADDCANGQPATIGAELSEELRVVPHLTATEGYA